MDFNNFKKELKELGFLDNQDTFFNYRIASQWSSTADFYIYGGKVLFNFNLRKGNCKWGNLSFTVSYHNIISRLKEFVELFTKIVTDLGLPVEKEHMRTMLMLKARGGLVGSANDWIPYVCAGLTMTQLEEILTIENNPDYATTRTIKINVASAQSLNSMHPMFKKLLIEH